MDRAVLLNYVHACDTWAARVQQMLDQQGDRRDFATKSARNRVRNDYELRLGDLFAAAGLMLEPEVGVSKDGGSRRGGWYGSYWLDWAYRSAEDALLLDVEMDGRHHTYGEQIQRDLHRNEQLRRRGWYILRVPSSALREPGACERIVAQTIEHLQRHRQAHAIAHVGTATLMNAFTAYDAALGTRVQDAPVPMPAQAHPSSSQLQRPLSTREEPFTPPSHHAPQVTQRSQGHRHPILRTIGYLWAGISIAAGLTSNTAAFWSGLVFLFIVLATTDAWSLRQRVPLLNSPRRGRRVLGYTLLVILYLAVLTALSPPRH